MRRRVEVYMFGGKVFCGSFFGSCVAKGGFFFDFGSEFGFDFGVSGGF